MPAKRIFTNEQKENVVDLYVSGKNIDQIYKMTQIIPKHIRGFLKERNIKIRQSTDYPNRKPHNKKLFFTKEQIDDMITRYNRWESLEEIGKQYKVSVFSIQKVLVNNNITIRKCGDRKDYTEYITNKKYYCDETYFEVIDTEEKAYWLGFLFADGCVSLRKGKDGHTKGGTLEFTLKYDDEYVLYNFLKCINGNYKIIKRNVQLNGKEFYASRLSIYSIKMCRDLINLGCIPAKSLILQPPTRVPEKYINAFIRGIFDGDGHFGFYPNQKSSPIHIEFAGNEYILSWIKSILLKQQIKCSALRKDKRHNVYTIDITGRPNMAKFYNYLYNDCSFMLDRKKDLFEEAMKKYNVPINRGWIATWADMLED